MLADSMSLPAGLKFCLLHRVRLKKAVERFLFTPVFQEVVKFDLACIELTNDWELPTGELDGEARCLAREELDSSLDRRCQPASYKSPAVGSVFACVLSIP